MIFFFVRVQVAVELYLCQFKFPQRRYTVAGLLRSEKEHKGQQNGLV
jgi:hypothetical protein